MNQENNSFHNSSSSQDDIKIQVEGSTTATTIIPKSFSSIVIALDFLLDGFLIFI
jgi:hypothetical protein